MKVKKRVVLWAILARSLVVAAIRPKRKLTEPEWAIRRGMLEYPSIFPDKLRVLQHFFSVIGNGYDWENGGLTYSDPERRKYAFFMDYEDLIGESDMGGQYRDTLDKKGKKLYDEMQLESRRSQAPKRRRERALRLCTEWDVNVLVQGRLGYGLLSMGEPDYMGHYEIYPCYRYALGLNFPDDIDKKWGELLYEYLDWWVKALRYYYRKDDQNPQQVRTINEEGRKGMEALLASRKRLAVIIGRKDPEVAEAEMVTMLRDLWKEIK